MFRLMSAFEGAFSETPKFVLRKSGFFVPLRRELTHLVTINADIPLPAFIAEPILCPI